jgi:glycine C-acetyltransferase
MQRRGIFVTAFSYPVVPKGEARIRVQLSAAHSEDQIRACVAAFAGAAEAAEAAEAAGTADR